MKNIRDVQGRVFYPWGKGENLWGKGKNPWGRAKKREVFSKVASGDAQQIEA